MLPLGFERSRNVALMLWPFRGLPTRSGLAGESRLCDEKVGLYPLFRGSGWIRDGARPQ